MNIQATIPTDKGVFTAGLTERGVARLDFPSRTRSASALVKDSGTLSPAQQRWLKLTTLALKSVLAGQKPKALPPLDWSGSTDFQRSVWGALLGIGTGQTRTYAGIAREIGRPLAARAVGGACGANPVPVLVPCHRVLATSGRIGGFSGGLDWKRDLLEIEGVVAK
jgi:methylated-DNA-[protein]-cysteine S-methyltransferase